MIAKMQNISSVIKSEDEQNQKASALAQKLVVVY